METIFKREIRFNDFGFEGLTVFRSAFKLAMDVFEVSKTFPKKEKYSLTDLSEGYRKRLENQYNEVGRILNYMFQHPEKYIPKEMSHSSK
jgi:hypothetical protein